MRPCIPRLRSARCLAHRTLGGPARRHSTHASSTATPTAKQRVDPFALTGPTLASLRTSILPILTSGHPALSELTSYYFLHPSKQIRPLIIVLLSLATNGLGSRWETKYWQSQTTGAGGKEEELDWPLTRTDVLNDWNPERPKNVTGKWEDGFTIGQPVHERLRPHTPPARPSSPSSAPTPFTPSTVLPSQLRLAQIVELVHAASLLHDDVIDASPLRRGAPSAPAAFGNKLSVLGGNFVLGRASAALSRLGDPEVTELIASVISNLVEGEILQMRDVIVGNGNGNGEAGLAATALSSTEKQTIQKDVSESMTSVTPDKIRDAWNIYIQKTYLKTASLMAKGARAAVALGGCVEGEIHREIAYAYGRNLGIAFQLVDDVLDYASPSDTLGKPGGADLQLGLATGPALYAWEEHPEMGELIARKFEGDGDVEKARALVQASSGVERTRQLALAYANKAKEVLQRLPESEAREGLEVLAEKVIGRKA
ncbi:hypothetical protein AX16_009459 [Volvariella volvacea WC 439]|nr:hypothetical protein AX16_009459 [Volvariella volvacea WC 439]